VALKIIMPGMDTRQVIRFEAERQAPAMMDHPNIARVFDAGTTDAGRRQEVPPHSTPDRIEGQPLQRDAGPLLEKSEQPKHSAERGKDVQLNGG